MVKAEPDIITTEKRIQHKRNRLFLTGCILLLFAGLFWLISWMQHFELETFYAMATINPVDLSIAVGAAGEAGIEEGQFVTIGGVLGGYLSYLVPFSGAVVLVVCGVAMIQAEAWVMVFAVPFMGAAFLMNVLVDDEPKTLPKAPIIQTAALVLTGEVDELLRALTTENPNSGLILKDAMEKGINDDNAVTQLEGYMRQGYAAGDTRRAMNMSLALVQALTVAAENTSDKAEGNKLLDQASRVAGLSVRIMKSYGPVKNELAYRLYELAQRLEPDIANNAKPAIELKYQESAKTAGVLRTLKGVFLMMAVILIVLAGFANRNLCVLKQLKTDV
ncbi:hypothetical protein J0A78_02005 [Providencia rettgeri]|uniref:Uncharacterized protein n=1 Tax=Morganella psychrotolerans TaxID=368603 RepID=A0A1B8HM84_9GAMM|nr:MULTISPECIES: hypothetical protein [Morganellaceae]MBN7840623.1 hypothetical protein [Providencia rettgeri]MBN7854892.1 hypothetical protein [Providencia rettgeri]MBN7860652.1 hypothetical protein [Providencia rettgeri]MBN7870790.1 hypothetical protein [Providencia rettgeri]MBN7896157.1 hypothetical protein [Providencia rettgeri]